MEVATSIIIPLYNELESAPGLIREVQSVMDQLPGKSELILVDDGSTDGTSALLDRLADEDPRLVVIHFRRNFGQTAALQAGLEQSRGERVVLLDGDGQNDPADIPMMLEQLDQGYDLVHGWRRNRQDAWLSRKLPSRVANWLISKITRFPVHDLGCTLKAMRREIADDIELYGEMHRFIPILAHWRGANCIEVEVHHRPRRFGKSKYGLSRTFRVLMDLITVKYMLDHFTSPMLLYGWAGALCAGLGIAMISTSVVARFGWGADMTSNPLLGLGAILGVVSLQFFAIGLICEINTRLYYRRGDRRPFAIRKIVRKPTPPLSVAPETRPKRRVA